MAENAKQLLNGALELPAKERAALAEQLLASLDKPDPSIDKLWAKEAEDRIDAFDEGEIEAMSAEEVFEKYSKK